MIVCHHQILISYVSTAILVTLAVVLAGLPTPRSRRWLRWSISRWFMVATFSALALVSYLMAECTDAIWQKTVVIWDTSFQALLLAATATTLVAPLEVTMRRIVIQIVLIMLLAAQLIVVQCYFPTLYYYSYGLYICFFIFQVRYYAGRFRRFYKQTESALYVNYDDEEASLRLRPVLHIFCSALIIGAVMLVIFVLPMSSWLYTALVVLYTVYYTWVCVTMIGYRIKGDYIIKIVGEPGKAMMPDGGIQGCGPVVSCGSDCSGVSIASHYDKLEDALQRWVEQRGFIESDVTTEQLAERMGVSRNEFITYFQQVHNTTFRSWRMRLRLEEAERLIRSTPGLQVSCLYELVGFNDRSNFHTKFTEFTGLTPRTYQQENGPRF